MTARRRLIPSMTWVLHACVISRPNLASFLAANRLKATIALRLARLASSERVFHAVKPSRIALAKTRVSILVTATRRASFAAMESSTNRTQRANELRFSRQSVDTFPHASLLRSDAVFAASFAQVSNARVTDRAFEALTARLCACAMNASPRAAPSAARTWQSAAIRAAAARRRAVTSLNVAAHHARSVAPAILRRVFARDEATSRVSRSRLPIVSLSSKRAAALIDDTLSPSRLSSAADLAASAASSVSSATSSAGPSRADDANDGGVNAAASQPNEKVSRAPPLADDGVGELGASDALPPSSVAIGDGGIPAAIASFRRRISVARSRS